MFQRVWTNRLESLRVANLRLTRGNSSFRSKENEWISTRINECLSLVCRSILARLSIPYKDWTFYEESRTEARGNSSRAEQEIKYSKPNSGIWPGQKCTSTFLLRNTSMRRLTTPPFRLTSRIFSHRKDLSFTLTSLDMKGTWEEVCCHLLGCVKAVFMILHVTGYVQWSCFCQMARSKSWLQSLWMILSIVSTFLSDVWVNPFQLAYHSCRELA